MNISYSEAQTHQGGYLPSQTLLPSTLFPILGDHVPQRHIREPCGSSFHTTQACLEFKRPELQQHSSSRAGIGGEEERPARQKKPTTCWPHKDSNLNNPNKIIKSEVSILLCLTTGQTAQDVTNPWCCRTEKQMQSSRSPLNNHFSTPLNPWPR